MADELAAVRKLIREARDAAKRMRAAAAETKCERRRRGFLRAAEIYNAIAADKRRELHR